MTSLVFEYHGADFFCLTVGLPLQKNKKTELLLFLKNSAHLLFLSHINLEL